MRVDRWTEKSSNNSWRSRLGAKWADVDVDVDIDVDVDVRIFGLRP